MIIKTAKAGKHVFTEKALCPTVAECEDVKKAILDAGVTFTISYPMRGTPTVQFAKKMIESGAFGKLSLVRIRNGHNGVSGNWLPAYWFEKKDAAGGAMMDLGCHPMYTLPYLCGKPKRINGIFTAPFGSKVDENAVSTIEFEGGIIGIAETSFITYATKEMIEIYGSEGTLISINGDVQFNLRKPTLTAPTGSSRDCLSRNRAPSTASLMPLSPAKRLRKDLVSTTPSLLPNCSKTPI